MDWTLEVVNVPVSNVDQGIAFYRDQMGFNLDFRTSIGQMDFAQLTPPGSGCSIVVGDENTRQGMPPGSLRGLQLVVTDVQAARQELLDRGVEVGGVTILDERDGGTFFSFADPDGNTWAVQEMKVRADKPLIPREARITYEAQPGAGHGSG